jgi:carbon starvation protein
MAFSTFVFDTIDVATRLGRYILQELFSWKSKMGAAVATLLTLSIPVMAIFMAQEGSWIEFWTLFGAANQLLAGLTLLCITVWLIRSGRSFLFTLVPMAFVLVVTIWALSRIVLDQLKKADGLSVQTINALVAGILIALALYLLAQAVKVVRKK